MASRPISSLFALATMAVVAFLSMHPSLAAPHTFVQSKYICGSTQYQNNCGPTLSEQSVITINLVTSQSAANGVNACQDLPDNATLAEVRNAYRKCAEEYQSLQKNAMQPQKYSTSKQHEHNSSLDMIKPQDITNSCPFIIDGNDCWVLEDIA